MADTNNKLPEGTDAIIDSDASAVTIDTSASERSGSGGEIKDISSTATPIRDEPVGSEPKTGIRGLVGNVSTKARDEATSRARGLVGNGLKSSSSTLGNIAGIIEDTVEQIGERLGPQYADYARTASQTINRYATTLESKDPDELVDDAREIIRKSPGVALAGAAIIGFGLVRLLKAGLPEDGSDRGTSSDRQGRSTAGKSTS